MNIEGVIGADEVLLILKIGSRLVLKERGNFLNIEAVEAVEIEVLKADARQELVLANGFGALGKNRAETLTGARVNAEAGIEAIEEPRGRRWNRCLLYTSDAADE